MDKDNLEQEEKYEQLHPCEALRPFIHSYWIHRNLSNSDETISIFPDSYFKVIFVVQNDEIIKYFMTGFWTEQKQFTILPNAYTVGCRLRILAPEYLIEQEVSSILNKMRLLPLSYLGLELFQLGSFEHMVSQWDAAWMRQLPEKPVKEKKQRFSDLIYSSNGSITAAEVADEVQWSNRQINRYLNQYIGLSLKKYQNIQKCYQAYVQIREGRFFPDQEYFDQAHFIREVKKHTGQTPRELFDQQNDRFIQLKHIVEK